MRCQKCQQRDALVHLTQQEGNRVGKVSICDECAAELGVYEPKGIGSAQPDWSTLITEHGKWKQRGSEPLDG